MSLVVRDILGVSLDICGVSVMRIVVVVEEYSMRRDIEVRRWHDVTVEAKLLQTMSLLK
jgi:hypothetical protein